MKRGPILLVSWSVPPGTSGSAIIVGNLARQFARDDMVVLGARPHGRPQMAWDPAWARMVYVTREWPTGWRGARFWRRLTLPWLLLRVVATAVRLRPRAVVAVFPSGDSLLAGVLASVVTGAPLYPYFHNTYVENRTGLRLWVAAPLQAWAFRRAAHVFVMSDGMLAWFQARYPEVKSSALVHSFNETIPEPSPQTAPPVHTPLRLVLCGNVNASCNDAAQRLAQAIAARTDIDLTLISGTESQHLQRVGLLRPGVKHITVARDALLQHLAQADVLLLPHGFHGGLSAVEYRTIFPTKTIEYLISGRPILAHSPKEAFLTTFLRAHNCALVVDTPEVEALQEALNRLRDDGALRAQLVVNAWKAAQMFYGPRVLEAFRSVIEARAHD